MNIKPPKIYKSEDKLPKGVVVTDIFESVLTEFFFIENPGLKNSSRDLRKDLSVFLSAHKKDARWVYYPWRKIALKAVSEKIFYKVRTARNRNLITEAEQQKFKNTVVGIAGMSVGSQVFLNLVASGGAKNIKLADFDRIELSNLNRMRANAFGVGEKKVTVVARIAWEHDPFAKIKIFASGLNRGNLKKFISERPALDIFVDEVDDFNLKFFARAICRERRVPVLMATDNSEGVLLDIERFDLEPRRQLFHGRLEGLAVGNISRKDVKKWHAIAERFIGRENTSDRMRESIAEVGRSLGGVPQLGYAASISGAVISYAIKLLANGYPLPSGRFIIKLEDLASQVRPAFLTKNK